MALQYGLNNAVDFASSKIVSFASVLSRTAGQPMDKSQLWYPLDGKTGLQRAQEYAATASAYVGQELAVVDVAYEEDGTTVKSTSVKFYGIQDAAGTLKELGAKPTGDDASISVDAAGLVSVFGFAGAQNGTLPVREDGKLTWKTLEDIGAGDGNDNTTYQFAVNEAGNGFIVTPLFNGQPIMEGEEGAQTQVKYEVALDVYTKTEADSKFLAKDDYTPYDDSALANKISDLEATVNGVAAAEGVEAVKGLVEKVAENAQAIEDITKAETGAIAVAIAAEAEARDDAIQVVNDKIGDVAEGSTVVSMISAVENKIPTVPTNVSAFTNDAGYLTAHQDISGKADKAETLAGYGIGDAYTKTEVDTAIDNAKKSLLGENVSEAYDTLKEIQNILEGTDGETIDGLIEAVDANKNAIATLNGDASTEGSVDKKIATAVAPLATTEALNAVKATAEAAQTADQVADAIDSKIAAENLSQYAVAETVNAELAKKANTADVVANDTFETFKTNNSQAIADARSGAVSDVEAKGYAVASEVETAIAGVKATAEAAATKTYVDTELAKKANADIVYTKSEIDTKIGVAGTPASGTPGEEGYVAPKDGTGIFASTYSKAEINALLDEIEGGSTESAASVARQLDEFKSATNNTLALIDQKDTDQDTAIEDAQADATQALADAATAQNTADAAQSAISILTSGQVATNAKDIGILKALVTGEGSETPANSHSTRIGALESYKTTHTEEFNTLKGRVDTNETEIAKKANNADVYNKTTIDGFLADKADKSDTYTKKEVDDAVAGAIAKIPAVDFTPYAKVTDVEAIYKAGVDGEAASGVLADEIARAKAAEKVNADAIAVLVGTVDGDNAKSARAIAKEEVALIVGAAPEALNTLEEVATWIANDESGAAAMANDIAALKTKVDTGDKSVSKYVEDAIAAIPATPIATTEVAGIVKASDEVAVAADGKMTIAKVSTDVLAQGTEILILNGGNAGTEAAE